MDSGNNHEITNTTVSSPTPNDLSTSTTTTTITTNYDYHIMKTADDALKAKYAAVQAKYYIDPFIGTFYHQNQSYSKHDKSYSNQHQSTSSSSSSSSSSPPAAVAALPPVQVIIKRGTYARVMCIYKTIANFLNECQKDQQKVAQVIVLGSGKDTTFFRIVKERYEQQSMSTEQQLLLPALHWFEVDHESILQQKTNIIEQNPTIFAANSHRVVSNNMNGIYKVQPHHLSDANVQCHFIGHNLNNDTEQLINTLIDCGMDTTVPTLIVLECVLMYIKKDVASRLLQIFSTTCLDCIVVSYEPILGINSTFGRVMEDNLNKVGIVQPTSCLLELRTVQQYIQQLYSINGYKHCIGCDMYTVYETILSQQQRAHAQKCEFLDELEEFILIMQHYCFIVSCNNSNSIVGRRLCTIGTDDNSNPIGFIPGRCEHL